MDCSNQYQSSLNKVKELTTSTNKRSVLIVMQDPVNSNHDTSITAIRESISNIICVLTVGGCSDAERIISSSKDIIDYVLIDNDIKRDDSAEIIEVYKEASDRYGIKCSFYSDFETWAGSAINYIECVTNSDLKDKSILILGRNPLVTKLVISLVSTGTKIFLNKEEYREKTLPVSIYESISLNTEFIKYIDLQSLSDNHIDILLGCSIKKNNDSLYILEDCTIGTAFDIGIKNFSKEFIAKHDDTCFYRSDDRAGIASAVINKMETDYLVNSCLGKVSFGGVNVVSGGYIGEEGSIVVDNAYNPCTILGIAKGDGTFKHDLTETEKKNIEQIKSLL